MREDLSNRKKLLDSIRIIGFSIACFVIVLINLGGCSPDVKPVQLINSLTPPNGKPGTTVVIDGTNFLASAGNKVDFMGAEATIVDIAATKMTVTVPTEATTGVVSLTMNGKAVKGPIFTVIPSVVSFSPLCGPVGSDVIVNGTNFDSNSNNTYVIFSEQTGAMTGKATVKTISSKQILFNVPSGIPGTFTTRLLISGLWDSSFYPPFYIKPYTVTGYAPTRGKVGTVITIDGTGFNLDKSNDVVSFNGPGETSIVVPVAEATSTQLKVVVPSGVTSGIIAVKVNSPTDPYIIFPIKFILE